MLEKKYLLRFADVNVEVVHKSINDPFPKRKVSEFCMVMTYEWRRKKIVVHLRIQCSLPLVF